MNFASALFSLKRGHHIKRRHWKGYWYKDEHNEVYIHTYDGKDINIRESEDIMYTLENLACDDWVICDKYHADKELDKSRIEKILDINDPESMVSKYVKEKDLSLPCCVGINPAKSSFTQDEFIALCKAGLQSQIKVGTLIKLNNKYRSIYEVIGVNHDGTSGTVDIMSHMQIGNMGFGNSGYYAYSDIRNYINIDFFEAFDSSIQNLAKTMSVVTNDITVTDKVKILSCSEVNYHLDNYIPVEGTVYEAFANASTTPSLRWRGVDKYRDSSDYWLRTYFVSDSTIVHLISSSGGCGHANCYHINGVLPVLRF